MVINRIHLLNGNSTVAFARVTYPAGAVCIVTNGTTTLRASDTSGYAIFRIPSLGSNWVAACSQGSGVASQALGSITRGYTYDVTLSFRVPSAYTEVAYLQSSGTQFINTGFVFQSDLSRRIEIKFRLLSDRAHSVGGTYDSAIGLTSMFGFPTYVDGNGLYEMLTTYYNSASGAAVGTDMTVVFNDASHNVTENGTQVLALASGVYNCSRPFYLFGVNFDGSLAFGGSTRIYSFKYYNALTNTLLAEYVPCIRKSDNVAGFWDTVSETFKTNDGSGTFTTGSTV